MDFVGELGTYVEGEVIADGHDGSGTTGIDAHDYD